ncbi:MAG: hypothetical protein ABSD58_03485 [Verrucomicrobiia bacterium]|jgi:hypothetical protein
MNDSPKVFRFGSLLIESPGDENEEHFRAYVTELLVEIYGRLPEWLEFKVGRRFERKDLFYREFLCSAGSVDSRIQLRAQQLSGIPRSIILRGTSSGVPFCIEICSGIEMEFDCTEVRPVGE